VLAMASNMELLERPTSTEQALARAKERIEAIEAPRRRASSGRAALQLFGGDLRPGAGGDGRAGAVRASTDRGRGVSA